MKEPLLRASFTDEFGKRHKITTGRNAERNAQILNGLNVIVYRDEAGGTYKHTIAIVNGQENNDFAPLQGISIRIDGGESYIHSDKWGILPGGIWTKTFWSGNPKNYFEAKYPILKCPTWSEGKMVSHPIALATIGPYNLYWHHLGWMYGGQGIDPNWFGWRMHATGYKRAWDEMLATAQRNPIAYYLDEYANPGWKSSPKYSLQTIIPPAGYSYDLDCAAEWWQGVRNLAEYQRHDGQHFHRAYRAALIFKDDPFAKDYLSWLMNHLKLAWYPDPNRDYEPSYYWTARQIKDHLEENPGPSYRLGREFAHVARLVWTLEPESEFSQLLEDIVKLAASGSCPSPYMTTMQPSMPGIEIAACFELHFLALAMKLRPGLQVQYDNLMNFVGTYPQKYITPDGRRTGDKVPFTHLMFKDLIGETLEYWLTMGSARQVDAGGSQPMNYLPREVWEDSV